MYQFRLPSAVYVVWGPQWTNVWFMYEKSELREASQGSLGWRWEAENDGCRGISLHTQNLPAQRTCRCFPWSRCGPPWDSWDGIILGPAQQVWEESNELQHWEPQSHQIPRGWKRSTHLPCQRKRRWVAWWGRQRNPQESTLVCQSHAGLILYHYSNDSQVTAFLLPLTLCSATAQTW